MSARWRPLISGFVDPEEQHGSTLPGETPAVPRTVILVITGLVLCLAVGLWFGRLDVITAAPGRLVPAGFVQIVQPRDRGVVRALHVREGDRVGVGQVIASLDARELSAESEALQRQRATAALQFRRIDAELAGLAFDRRAGDSADLYRQARQHYEGRRAAHDAAMRAERALVVAALHEHEAARAREAKFRQSVPLLKEQADAWQQLLDEGFAGRLQARERLRAYVEAARDFEAESARVSATAAEVVRAQERVAHLDRAHREQLLAERAETQAALTRLDAEVTKQHVSHESLELRAPRAGIVKDLATHTLGAVVQAGTVLATLVPSGDALEAEVHVAQLDSGLVTPGQRVRLKVATFPFHRYGTVSGTVRHLGPDAWDPSMPSAVVDPTRTPEPAGYRAFVALDSQALSVEGRRHDLTAGMQVSAEIHLGTRSVLDYLLAPVARTLGEAARER